LIVDLAFSQEKSGRLFEMVHVIFLDTLESIVLINVVEVWSSEHAEEEEKVHHGDRYTGS